MSGVPAGGSTQARHTSTLVAGAATTSHREASGCQVRNFPAGHVSPKMVAK